MCSQTITQAQWLGALGVFAEELGSITTTHMVAHSHL